MLGSMDSEHRAFLDGSAIYLRKKRQALSLQIKTMVGMQLIMAGGYFYLLTRPGASPLYAVAVCLYLLYTCGSWVLAIHLNGSADEPNRLFRRVGWLSTALLILMAASIPAVNALLTRDQPLALAALVKGMQVEVGIIVIFMSGLALERGCIKVTTAVVFGLQVVLFLLARLDDRILPTVRTFDNLMSPALHFGHAMLRMALLPVAGWVALLYVRSYAELLSRLRPLPRMTDAAAGGSSTPGA